jgi:hypothetical protein
VPEITSLAVLINQPFRTSFISRSKNIKILQTVMGHSDMAVSLTYLRGLDVNELDVDMLPGLAVN